MSSRDVTDSLFITESDVGERLDKLLIHHFPTYSRTYFQYLIENQAVLVNGKSAKKRDKLILGDEIEICFLLTEELSAEPENIPLDILYEDEALIAINKPANFVVHPAPGSPSGTFANALLYHCQSLNHPGFDPLRPGIVHRLDKDTTGVLIAAKTYEAHQKLISQFSARTIDKRYLAITAGRPKDGLLSAPIKRHPIHRQEMIIDPEGKEAISKFAVKAHKEGLSLVEVQILTGRTHQIRVHLKALNCPILGDPLYGSPSLNQKYKLERQLLHAASLTFQHPISQKKIQISAPIPHDMQNFIAQIGKV